MMPEQDAGVYIQEESKASSQQFHVPVNDSNQEPVEEQKAGKVDEEGVIVLGPTKKKEIVSDGEPSPLSI